jgi:hypothetical protein
MKTSMDDDVEIEYQLTEAEYLAANRLLFFSKPDTLLRIIAFSLLLLIGAFIFSFLLVDIIPLWTMFLFVGLFEGLLVYNLLVKMPRTYYRGDGKFRDKYEITFSDEHIRVKTSQLDSKLAWSLYTKVLEGPDMYLLIYGRDVRMMTAVPKRSFTSKDQERRFRDLVSRHILDHSNLKPLPPGESEYRPTSLTPPDWR